MAKLIFQSEPARTMDDKPGLSIKVYQDGATVKIETNGFLQASIYTNGNGDTVVEVSPA